jgi:hypothetical protein
MESLFKDPNGNFSVSKMWSNIAYIVSSYVVIVNVKDIGWELLLVYMAVVGGSEVAKKLITMKYGSQTDNQPEKISGSSN